MPKLKMKFVNFSSYIYKYQNPKSPNGVYIYSIMSSLLDIDRLKNSVLSSKFTLIKLKSQILCELNGVDKNNEDFKTKENIKTELLARVDDLIGFVKQTNDVIREYNQKAAKDSYVLRGKLQWSNYLI